MGKDYLGKDARKVEDDGKEEKEIKSLDEGDIKLLKSYGQGPYSKSLKQVEADIADTIKRVNELAGIKVRIFLLLFQPVLVYSNCQKFRKDHVFKSAYWSFGTPLKSWVFWILSRFCK